MGLFGQRTSSGGGRSFRPQIIIGVIIAGIALFSYYGKPRSKNPTTGELQRVGDMTPDQEVALGLAAAGEMAGQFGGPHPDQEVRLMVDEVGRRIVDRSDVGKTSPYKFTFHALADPTTVNAFALPGGQIFITRALLDRMDSPGQLAGVLGHEIGHVVGRHGAEHLAKAQLTQGLVGAVVIGMSDGQSGGQANAAIAQMVGSMINMKHGRNDELESDRLGVRYMSQAGYDPRSMIRVMEILREASGGNGRQPKFMSTHPDPGRRVEQIEDAIEKEFPNGVPEGLEK